MNARDAGELGKRPGERQQEEEAPARADQQEAEQRAEQARRREEAEEAEKKRVAELGHQTALLANMHEVLANKRSAEALEGPLSDEEREALARLVCARDGKDELGQKASGRERSRLLNQALARLWPVLAAPEKTMLEPLQKLREDVEYEVVDLKHEIRQNMLVEAHRGRLPQQQSVDKADQLVKGAKLSELGSLCWELAQLGRRKRRRAGDEETEPPTDEAAMMDAMMHRAELLGVIGARYAVLEARLLKVPPLLYKRIGAIKKQMGKVRAQLIHNTRAFLEDCKETDHPLAPGAYAELREQFAPLVARLDDVGTADQAAAMAIEIVRTIDASLGDDGNDPPADAAKPRGLRRLFSRGKN